MERRTPGLGFSMGEGERLEPTESVAGRGHDKSGPTRVNGFCGRKALCLWLPDEFFHAHNWVRMNIMGFTGIEYYASCVQIEFLMCLIRSYQGHCIALSIGRER